MKNFKAYLALAFLAITAFVVLAQDCKPPGPDVRVWERVPPVAGLEGEANWRLYHEASNSGLNGADSKRYVTYCNRTTGQYVANANEIGEPRYPRCSYPPMPPEVWAAKGKQMPVEPVFLTEEEQEKREAAKWDAIFAQQAQYNGPVGNRPTP